MRHELPLILAANRLPGHNGYPKLRLLEKCRDEADMRRAISLYMAGRNSRSRLASVDPDRLFLEAEAEEKKLKNWRINCLILGESGYPSNLAMIADPPLVLYCRGNFDTGSRAAIAVVGTRRPTARSRREAYRISLEFALASHPVVSGLAFGIDRSAHEGALDGGGSTWAVLAGGLDRPSPFSHRHIAARILDNGGALLGEIPPGGFPLKYAFPRRNRILSGLCKATLIVQAPKKSGALITADFALDQDRDLYVAESGLVGPNCEGTLNLESQGAPIIRCAADILLDWGIIADIPKIHALSSPCGPADLVRYMKLELDGHMYRNSGGCFEYRSP